jgi:methyl-accepting chemotaxis protein
VNDNITITNRNLRRGHFAVTGVTFAIVFGSLAVVGELNDLIVWLMIAVGVIALPVTLLHLTLVDRLLGPVRSLMDRGSEQSSLSQADGMEAIIALERFEFREQLYSFIWWVGGAFCIGMVLFSVHRITSWQLFIFLCHGVAAGMIDALIASQVNSHSLRGLRDEVEALCPTLKVRHRQLSQLNYRMVWAFLMAGLLSVGLSSLFWLNELRIQRGQNVLVSKEGQFNQAADMLSKILKADPLITPSQLIRKVEPSELRKELSIINAFTGLPLTGSESVENELTITWMKRIIEEGKDKKESGEYQNFKNMRWPSVRAPFLFMTLPIGKDRLLMWVGSLDAIYEGLGLKLGIIGAGECLLLVLCALLGWTMMSSSLSNVRSLTNQIQRLKKGDFEVSVDGAGSGELSLVARSIGDLAEGLRKQHKHDAQIKDELQETQSSMVQQTTVLLEGSDKSAEMAEQTASGMIQMRASIQSISEQVDSLRDVASECSSSMLEIDQSVREVAAAAENLQTQVDDTVSAISQISISMGEVAGNVDQLTSLTEESTGAISSMDASNKRVEESTSETHRLSQEVSEIAKRGAESVEQTIAGINDIRSVTDEARDVINRLGNQVGAVGKILTVIGDVAAQTNLLALNAAIIAASAGEYGKGFAVVAEEIKDLADRTSTSTKEIAGLIKAVQAESRRAVDAMERGTGSVRRGVELANNAGQSLQQILSSVQQASQKANEISKSTVEHSTISRRMTKLMADVSEMAQSIKRAVGEQARAGVRIGRVGEKMREEAHFVLRSTNEQSQAATGVTHNFERVSEMIGAISRALTEQSQGVNHIAKAAESVRDTLQQDRTQVVELAQLSERIGLLAGSMAESIKSSVNGKGVPDEGN